MASVTRIRCAPVLGQRCTDSAGICAGINRGRSQEARCIVFTLTLALSHQGLIRVGKCAVSYELQLTSPLSLRERVGVRVNCRTVCQNHLEPLLLIPFQLSFDNLFEIFRANPLSLDGLIRVGKCAVSYELQLTSPLSLRERVGVRVMSQISRASHTYMATSRRIGINT